MFCHKCGREIANNSEFCMHCGAKIVARASQIKESEQPLQEKNENGKKWGIIGGVALALVAVAVLLLIVLGSKDKPAGGQDELAGETADGADGVQTDHAGKAAVDLSLCFREVINNEGLPDARIILTCGYDNPDGEIIADLTTQSDGTVKTELEAGEYTLCWEAEGYYSGHENLSVSGAELNVVKHMLPVLTEQKAYVLIEWNSDRDLDLCVFNAQTKQYINIMSAVDDTGDFLYFDNDGAAGYELIYLSDYTAGIYTVYVCDAASLLQGTDSIMEAEGLTVSIYTEAGLLYREKADTGETAALWSPVYLYQGEANGLEDYIYDLTDYAWAVRDKKDDSDVRNEEALEVYGAFLRGEYATEDGRYLTDLLPEYEKYGLWNGYVDGINYAYLDLGADHVQELWVAFVGMDHYAINDGTTSEYILKYDGKALKICYECGFWGRGSSNVSYYGVVDSGGSNGATSYGFAMAILDADGNEIGIYTANKEWEITRYQEPFYSDGIDLAGEFETHGFSNLGLCIYEIAGSYYLVYDAGMNEDGISFEDVADVLRNLGYQLYTDAQIEEIIAEYIRQQGIEEWLAGDKTQLVVQTLDAQYYMEYAEPETLALTEEEIDVLVHIGRVLASKADENRGALDAWQIKEEIENSLYNGAFFKINEDSGESVGDYLYWYFDVDTLNDICDSLDFVYDFTRVDHRVYWDWVDPNLIWSGAYYEEGQLSIYCHSGMPPCSFQANGIYKEDGYWKLRLVSSDGGEQPSRHYSIWLRLINNELGYEIDRYTFD